MISEEMRERLAEAAARIKREGLTHEDFDPSRVPPPKGERWARLVSDEVILRAFAEHGSMRAAAFSLGITPQTVRRRLRLYGIDPLADSRR